MEMYQFRWLQLNERRDDGTPILVLQSRIWHHTGWGNWTNIPIEKEK